MDERVLSEKVGLLADWNASHDTKEQTQHVSKDITAEIQHSNQHAADIDDAILFLQVLLLTP